MEQASQNYRTGALEKLDVPAPVPGRGQVLVQTRASLASVGTERTAFNFARKSLIGKALSRRDLTRQVIEKAQAEGILEAWRQAKGRLDLLQPLGYSSAGVVVDMGPGVSGFAVGDRVACAGFGYAGHTHVGAVPVDRCVLIPKGVDFETASFVALGGIGLEAVRMAQVSLGDTVAVVGLGLVGLLTVQLLRASGCTVAAVDVDAAKANTALEAGAEMATTDYRQLAEAVRSHTGGRGADAIIIAASTDSNEPLEQAAQLARERGRVVATGLVGLEVPRKPFYDKELELVISHGWGPGTDDPGYSRGGFEYPTPYARWTARRNMEAFLQQAAAGALNISSLITHRFPFADVVDAYKLILEGREAAIGVVIAYPEESTPDLLQHRVWTKPVSAVTRVPSATDRIGVGVVGAGLFARGTLLPILRRCKVVDWRGVASTTGLSSRQAADKFGFDYCSSDYRDLLADDAIHAVLVLTRHGSHASIAVEALKAGKHVFVEKPLAVDESQLEGVAEALAANDHPLLMVGFNRRFSRFSRWLHTRLSDRAVPLAMHCTVNAGAVDPKSWVHDPEQGGGRVIGEVCHFVDLAQYLTGSLPVRAHAETLETEGYEPSDNVMVTLKMANGSVVSIAYLSGGDRSFPRERVEIIGGGAVGVIDNFKSASMTYKGKTQRTANRLSVDRGHAGELAAFFDAITTGRPPPVEPREYLATTLTTFAVERSLVSGQPIEVA